MVCSDCAALINWPFMHASVYACLCIDIAPLRILLYKYICVKIHGLRARSSKIKQHRPKPNLCTRDTTAVGAERTASWIRSASQTNVYAYVDPLRSDHQQATTTAQFNKPPTPPDRTRHRRTIRNILYNISIPKSQWQAHRAHRCTNVNII